MDLLVEKLDGSRYYLSQYKVLITDFEESAPSVTRNSKQLDQRNGNIDFGGWHTDKTINITGYYRAEDIDEEETLREKLYALLSDPNGYYITQLKTTPNKAMERPGETSGNYYDKLSNYPSHKRFLVYTEAPEMELVGNVNGTLLYKLTAEFKTMKLPYGETPAVDVAIDSPYKNVPVNLLTGTSSDLKTMQLTNGWNVGSQATNGDFKIKIFKGQTYTYRAWLDNTNGPDAAFVNARILTTTNSNLGNGTSVDKGKTGYSTLQITPTEDGYVTLTPFAYGAPQTSLAGWKEEKLEEGSVATPWSPNQADPEYNSWYYDLGGNISIPYLGTVPCNQLEQGFTVQLTTNGSASSLSFKIDDTELTSSNAVATGDVILLNGFSYTQNGLSIVSKTNKAYFILQPDKPNRITCNVPGTVQIIGLQNLYA